MSPDRLCLPAPAKLNLMLRIVGRRPDGYHLLQTVFQFIDRCDTITLSCRSDRKVVLSTPLPGVPVADDLTVRAALRLQEHTGSHLGVDIAIDKRLPMGGGLGGGSSDAATVLAGLNVLWNCGLSPVALQSIGLTLGADVPVFLHGEASWGQGVGEQLVSIDLPEPWYLVVVPSVHVPTAAIFGAPDLTRDNPEVTIRAFLDGDRENHCLPVVITRYPEVGAALDALGEVSDHPQLTGTGACVFASFGSEGEARAAALKIGSSWDCFTARGVNRSPLLLALADCSR